jgi:hypothetical protein
LRSKFVLAALVEYGRFSLSSLRTYAQPPSPKPKSLVYRQQVWPERPYYHGKFLTLTPRQAPDWVHAEQRS